MIKLRWKDQWINYESVTWSGTDNQCSRQVAFTIPSNPYDKGFTDLKIDLGDLIYLYDDKKQLFVGTVTSRERTAEIGSASYTAMDFMHHLLKSSGTYKFQKTTPEAVVKKICTDLEIKTGKLAKTKFNLETVIFDKANIYDIMIQVYRKARSSTGMNYMPKMDGAKVTVIEKGQDSGVTLTQGVDVISASYNDSVDNMVNVVNIFSDDQVKLGQVRDKNTVSKYGVYSAIYTKEEGIDAKAQAKAMFIGVTKEASIEAIGNVKAVSGSSIEIVDGATGLKGTFYITSDQHTFSNGVHTMNLDLSWVNTMEGDDDNSNIKRDLINSAPAFYLKTGSVYHSSLACTALKGKKATKSTVAKMKKTKYKPCSKCWYQ